MRADPRRFRRSSSPRPRGFTLIEVLVALIIIAIGLLGIAKIQALAYSSTGTASIRSLAAIEAASLASAMRANRTYWSVGAVANTQITVSGTSVTSTDATLNALLGVAQDCTATGAAPCDVTHLAVYDLQQWASALNAVLPSDGATIACENATLPINCTITVSWVEKAVSVNNQGLQNTSDATAIAGPQTYTLYVEP